MVHGQVPYQYRVMDEMIEKKRESRTLPSRDLSLSPSMLTGTSTTTPPTENGAHPLEISMTQGTAQQGHLYANKMPQKSRVLHSISAYS